MIHKSEILKLEGPQTDRYQEVLKRVGNRLKTLLPQGHRVTLRAYTSSYGPQLMPDGSILNYLEYDESGRNDGMQLNHLDIAYAVEEARRLGYTVEKYVPENQTIFWYIY